MKIHTLFQDYLNYLEIEKNRAKATVENYKRYLKEFLKFSKAKSVGDITPDRVREFRLYLNRRPGAKEKTLKKVSQAYYIIALRNFLKYLAKRDIKAFSADKIELPKVPERQINVIEYKNVERLLSAPKGDSLRALRDRAILEILFSTGLRISELCALDRFIDVDRGEITVRGKGEKLRIVFLSNGAKAAVRAYMKKRVDADPALFVSITKGKESKIIGRIIPRAVQRLVNTYAKAAGIPMHVTPHQLRHAFATDLLMNGADIRSVQTLLGHSSITTTQIYTHVTNKELKEVHGAFHGRRRGA